MFWEPQFTEGREVKRGTWAAGAGAGVGAGAGGRGGPRGRALGELVAGASLVHFPEEEAASRHIQFGPE
jgi:hypothetical protein